MTSVTYDRKVAKFIESLSSDDIIYVFDGIRTHERFSHRKIRKSLRKSKASKRTVRIGFPAQFISDRSAKIRLLFGTPDLWARFLADAPLLLHDFVLFRLLPFLFAPYSKKFSLDFVYFESLPTDVDPKLISPETRLVHVQHPEAIALTNAHPQHHEVDLVGADEIECDCLIIDSGFYCHLPDRNSPLRYEIKWSSSKRLQKSRESMHKVISRLQESSISMQKVVIALHPNVYSEFQFKRYEPYECIANRTVQLLRGAKTVVSFGSSLTHLVNDTQVLILIDMVQEIRTSLTVRLIAQERGCECWTIR